MKPTMKLLLGLLISFNLSAQEAIRTDQDTSISRQVYRNQLSMQSNPAFAGDNGKHLVSLTALAKAINRLHSFMQAGYQTSIGKRHGIEASYRKANEWQFYIENRVSLSYSYSIPAFKNKDLGWSVGGSFNFDDATLAGQSTFEFPPVYGRASLFSFDLGTAIRNSFFYFSAVARNLNEPSYSFSNNRVFERAYTTDLDGGFRAFREGNLQIWINGGYTTSHTADTKYAGVSITFLRHFMADWNMSFDTDHQLRLNFYSSRLRAFAMYGYEIKPYRGIPEMTSLGAGIAYGLVKQ